VLGAAQQAGKRRDVCTWWVLAASEGLMMAAARARGRAEAGVTVDEEEEPAPSRPEQHIRRGHGRGCREAGTPGREWRRRTRRRP